VKATSLKSSLPRKKLSGSHTRKAHQIHSVAEDVLATTASIDMHTHLFPPSLAKLRLWGIDELLTYHYLEAEFFRFSRTTPQQYWALSKPDRPDAIWPALFVENTPMSEAAGGIIVVLKAFGLPTDRPNLAKARGFFRKQDVEEHALRVLKMAGVSSVVMTNDPLDSKEMSLWMKGAQRHPQFQPALRLDRILWEWSEPWDVLASLG